MTRPGRTHRPDATSRRGGAAPAAAALARTGALVALAAAGAVALGGAPLHAQGASDRGPPCPLPRGPFVVTDSSVRQEGCWCAIARSRDTIVSNYQRSARELRYRFSLDGRDNEFAPGTEYTAYLRPDSGQYRTPALFFGSTPAPRALGPGETGLGEDGDARVTLRTDLTQVLAAIRTAGRYVTPTGDTLTAPPRHVYAIGDVPPLTWDARALRPGSPAELTDADGDGIYEATLTMRAEFTRPATADGRAIWVRRLPIDAFPELTSPRRLDEALYRLALEELQQLVRPDSALSAGAKWEGVWTRDVSLASVLGLAFVMPDAVKRSLLAKLDATGRIIQDTGTGGSWPNSTDRTVWALAAWEVWAATGDRVWLRTAHDAIRRTAEQDLHAAFDRETGLFRGESAFLDWREQSYPRWMQPADIFQSQALGTNAIYHGAYRVLARMARALGEPSARWDSVATAVRDGIARHLWLPDSGWHAQYRYGRTALVRSPRAEGLGEALAILTGATPADRRLTAARRTPVVAWGTPSFWPYIPNERYYHNASVWPFVTAYTTWAAAEAGHTAGVEHGLAANTRAAALFLTNKENLTALAGHFEGTALNSDRQLWSVAGTLAATYRILFGMRLKEDRLAFRPMVPPAYGGERRLQGVRYRGATLDVTVRGHGTRVRRATLDGRPLARAELPATLAGAHAIVLEMDGTWPRDSVHLVPNVFAPETPVLRVEDGRLSWSEVRSAVRYVVHRDGVPVDSIDATRPRVAAGDGTSEWQVQAVDLHGYASFLSEPVRVGPADATLVARPEGVPLETEHAGYSGAGYVTLARDRNAELTLRVRVPRTGWYALDARYANGNGPVNTEDKSALRTLLVDGRERGVLVMPQRGVDRWTDWGWTNPVRVRLAAGTHTVTLRYTPLDENMNRRVNTALLDHVRLARLAPAPSPRAVRPPAR